MNEFEGRFKRTVDGVHRVFGVTSFRLLDENGNPEKNFNSAVFDAQMVGFALAIRPELEMTASRRRAFIAAYQRLQADPEFHRAITASTSDPPLVQLRVRMVRDLLSTQSPS